MKFYLNPKKALAESRRLRAAPEQDDTGLILVANGLTGSSIKLFDGYVRVTEGREDHKVTEIPIKSLISIYYLKHFTPIGITLTYLKEDKNEKVSVGASPTKRPEFDAMEKRIKGLMAEPEQQAAPQQASNLDELQKLAELRDNGIVTEEEFQAHKAKLLG